MLRLETLRAARNLARFVVNHPLNEGRSVAALARTLRWQVGSRVLGQPVVLDWVEGSRLIVRKGMTGATGNIYTGLHEYADMAFVLHYLRSGDLFVDVGANVGSYTVLAAAVCRCEAVSFEPVPVAFSSLRDNVLLNACEQRVQLHNMALGAEDGELAFTADLDTVNHVVELGSADAARTIRVPVKRLDGVLSGRVPRMVKLDVEGYEKAVLSGAPNTLRTAHALIMELNGSGARYGLSDDEAFALAVASGLTAAEYDPRSRLLRPLDHPSANGNTIFLRDVAEAQQRVRSAGRFRVFGAEI